MKFRILVSNGDRCWPEDYDKRVDDPYEWAKRTIKRFNDTCVEGEKSRRLLCIRVLDEESFAEHTWEKTNLFTIMPECYDTCKCKICGITGRRYGLSGSVVFDKKYKAKVYNRCDTSVKHLLRRKARE